MELLPKTITRPVSRLGAAAQNALEVARFGGLDTAELPSPYDIAAEQRIYRLRRYYAAGADTVADTDAGADARTARPCCSCPR
jgi:putative long chain acyl-CoA synthase